MDHRETLQSSVPVITFFNAQFIQRAASLTRGFHLIGLKGIPGAAAYIMINMEREWRMGRGTEAAGVRRGNVRVRGRTGGVM